MSVVETVTEFFIKNDYIGKNEVLDKDESLLEMGVVDSVVIMNLVDFLETEYRIDIAEDDMMPENFDSLNAIDDYVQRKTA